MHKITNKCRGYWCWYQSYAQIISPTKGTKVTTSGHSHSLLLASQKRLKVTGRLRLSLHPSRFWSHLEPEIVSHVNLASPHLRQLHLTSYKPRSSVTVLTWSSMGGETLACWGGGGISVFLTIQNKNARFPRPIGRAVSVERSRWNNSLCCSSLCHTCRWNLCLWCPGYGSTSAGTGTTPGAGYMCTDRAATSLSYCDRPESWAPLLFGAGPQIWSHPLL